MLVMLALAGQGQNHKWYYNYNAGKSKIGHDIVYGDEGNIYVADPSLRGLFRGVHIDNQIIMQKITKL